MLFSVAKRVVDESVSLSAEKIIILGRGEPFLHPKIYDMIRYAKDKGLLVTVLTNGSFGREDIEVLSRIDSFIINVSAATAKTYEMLQSNSPGSFKKVMDNLKLLSKIKKIRGRSSIEIKYVVCAQNIAEIREMILICRELGIDKVSFIPMFAVPGMEGIVLTPKLAKEYSPMLQKIIKDGGYFVSHSNIRDLHLLLGNIKKGMCVSSSSGNRLRYFKRIFDTGFKCYIGWYSLSVSLNGDVFFCCHHKIPGGNIYREPLSVIWQNQALREQRLDMKYKFNIRLARWKDCHNCLDADLFDSIRRRIEALEKKW